MAERSKPLCFAIMPFHQNYDNVSDIIKASAQKCGLSYVRGDHRNQPGMIMPQILDDIRRAAVIVADVSDHNPNVFYELGIAHQIKGPGPVVIITNSTAAFPFDVHAFRHLRYSFAASGQSELKKKLPLCLKEALASTADTELWSVTRGPLERTRLIVSDLKRLLTSRKGRRLNRITIRMIAGLGSLAISNHESEDSKLGQDYNKALLEERNALREALVHGAKLKALIHPPRRFTTSMIAERLEVRYQRLIDLLEGSSDIARGKERKDDLNAMKSAKFLVTPVPMPHLLIIGNKVAYEGMKRGGSRGYEMTHCETNEPAVNKLISEFDTHFNECQADSSRQRLSIADQLRGYYHEAIKSATG